jgi:hypothetical protein
MVIETFINNFIKKNWFLISFLVKFRQLKKGWSHNALGSFTQKCGHLPIPYHIESLTPNVTLDSMIKNCCFVDVYLLLESTNALLLGL